MPDLEALCLTEDADWEAVAARVGGQLLNRQTAPGAEPETILLIPADPAPAEPVNPDAARDALEFYAFHPATPLYGFSPVDADPGNPAYARRILPGLIGDLQALLAELGDDTAMAAPR